jgi:hypothetical protein
MIKGMPSKSLELRDFFKVSGSEGAASTRIGSTVSAVYSISGILFRYPMVYARSILLSRNSPKNSEHFSIFK